MRYNIVKETSPGDKNFIPTGQVFTSTADSNGAFGDDAVEEAATLQANDPSGCSYGVQLLGP